MHHWKLDPLRDNRQLQAVKPWLPWLRAPSSYYTVSDTDRLSFFKSWLFMANVLTMILFDSAAKIKDPPWLKITLVFSGSH